MTLWISYTSARKWNLETWKLKEMTTREMGWLGVAILLFIELLHTPNNALDILAKPPNLGAKWSNLGSKHLIATGSSRLCFALEKCIRYASSTIFTHVTVILDYTTTKSSSTSARLGQPSSWLGPHGLLLRMYSCLLMSPSVSHPRSVFHPSWFLGPSITSVLHHSRSIGTSYL